MLSVLLGAFASDCGNSTDDADTAENDESKTVDFKSNYIFWGAVILFVMVASINIYFGRVLLFCFLWLILACRFVILFFFFFRFFFGIIKIYSLNHRVFSICLHGL